jgi:hypothetical protein
MNRTLSPEVCDALHEIRDSKFMEESRGPVLILGAGKVFGTFIVGDW